jgi:hypothetical protein
MPENKTIKVSDWSQKYKLAIYAVSGTGLIFLGIKLVRILTDIKELLQQILLK